MRSFAHVLNPVAFKPEHALTKAQAVTMAAMEAAKLNAGKVPVEFISVQYPEDRRVIPNTFTPTRDLKRSILDITDFKKKRKLPFLRDLLQRAFSATRAEYLIFTNIDIAPMPFFYQAINQLIDEGREAFTVNRRTIKETPNTPDRLLDMYAQAGKAHPGHDCFVFPRAWVPDLILGDIVTGVPWIGLCLLANIACKGRDVDVIADAHLTFHLGDDQAWTSADDEPYRLHNTREAKAVLESLQARYGAFALDSYLGQHVQLAKRQLAAFEAKAAPKARILEPGVIAGQAIAQAALIQAQGSAQAAPPVPRAIGKRHLKPGQRLIFSINSGRCGSEYLAHLLGTAESTIATHEANPNMSGGYLRVVMQRPMADSLKPRMVKADTIAKAMASAPEGTAYVETNHMFIKSFYDVILKGFEAKDVSVILLRRHLPKVLKSFINLGYFSETNQAWPGWMHIAPDLRGTQEPRDQYDLAISYLLDIESKAQAFIQAYPDIQVVETRLEDLQTLEDATTLFESLGLRASPRTAAFVGQGVNGRSARKAQIGIETTLEYCETRLRAYVEAAQAASGCALTLPQLAA